MQTFTHVLAEGDQGAVWATLRGHADGTNGPASALWKEGTVRFRSSCAPGER
jgi:hypothetical protein